MSLQPLGQTVKLGRCAGEVGVAFHPRSDGGGGGGVDRGAVASEVGADGTEGEGERVSHRNKLGEVVGDFPHHCGLAGVDWEGGRGGGDGVSVDLRMCDRRGHERLCGWACDGVRMGGWGGFSGRSDGGLVMMRMRVCGGWLGKSSIG